MDQKARQVVDFVCLVRSLLAFGLETSSERDHECLLERVKNGVGKCYILNVRLRNGASYPPQSRSENDLDTREAPEI